MIAIISNKTPDDRVNEIVNHIHNHGVQTHISKGTDRTVIGIVGAVDPTLAEQLRQMKGIEEVIKITKSYKLASRDFQPNDTIIKIKDVEIGGDKLVITGIGLFIRKPEARAVMKKTEPRTL